MMYSLYRVQKSGEKQLVGFFDDPAEAGCAIDEDAHKFDDEAAYEMRKEENNEDQSD